MQESIETVDHNEQKLCEIAKHPFGIVVIYIWALLGLVVALGLSYFLLPAVMDDTDQAFLIAHFFALVTITLTIIGITISAIIYRQNRLIVTDINITQILQYGLFNRKVSQLNLINVEDVTSVQKGILSTLFGFGELKIETAGEQANFHFTYCPKSSYYANVILNAREKILGQHYEHHQRNHVDANDPDVAKSKAKLGL
jgi:uncharacterized membrane protein YdbT with pleckstrin-like domain